MIKKGLRFSMLTALLLITGVNAFAETPIGKWVTKDEQSGKEQSVIEIWQEGDELKGKIVELLEPEEENPLCEKCEGENHLQPIQGLTIISRLSQKGDKWVGGRILDPESGKVYKATVEVIEDGQTLKLRGYIGVKALGRTQYWRRAS